MDLKLTDKHVLVTGGSKGIGFATAMAFAREGARVTLVSRRRTALAKAAEQIRAETGSEAGFIAADLSEDEGRLALFGEAAAVDILVNNAGAIKSGPIEALGMNDWREGMDLKFWGYVHLCKLFSEQMCARKSGTIINIIGMGGRAVRPSYIIGAAANAGLIGFTSALGAATPADNVRVFGINPSVTKTDRMIDRLKQTADQKWGDPDRWEELVDPANYPFGRPKSAEEVAALAVMLASPQVHYLSGTVVDIDGGGRWTK